MKYSIENGSPKPLLYSRKPRKIGWMKRELERIEKRALIIRFILFTN